MLKRPGWPRTRTALTLLLGLCAGCAGPPACDRACVSQQLANRTGLLLRTQAPHDQILLPKGLDLERQLDEEPAVVVALWNNAAFQELLTELGITRADLVQAGLLPNPELAYFFHVPDKPFKYALDLPLEALWLRPLRLSIAGKENARACERLVQAGLDLIRDVRQTYADVLLARQRLKVAEEAVRLRTRIAELAEARVRAGDASAQEGATARIEMLQARQDAVRIGYELPLAEERLRHLLGIGDLRTPLTLDDTAPPLRPEFDADALTEEAVGTRPDVLAAARSVEAAAERLHFARLGWVRFLGILDATSGRATGREFGPGFRVTLPLFNRNQGGIARAEAELERAVRQQTTVHNQVILDVRLAHTRYAQARAELEALLKKVRPEVEAAVRRAESAYKEGNVAYVVVLETTRQLMDAAVREAQLHADLRRAWAELERSVGRRLQGTSP